MHLAQDRDQWQVLVNAVMNLLGVSLLGSPYTARTVLVPVAGRVSSAEHETVFCL